MTLSQSPGARRMASGLLAMATAAAVSACGAGLDAQTYQQRTAAAGVSDAVGSLALRNVSVEAPPIGEEHEVGSDVQLTITVSNDGQEQDALVAASSSAADEVVVLADGKEQALIVGGLESTRGRFVIELRGLTRPIRSGDYVDLALRFADNGTAELLVPVASPDDTDRDTFTAVEGDDHEPALQAPTGGHHGDESAESAD